MTIKTNVQYAWFIPLLIGLTACGEEKDSAVDENTDIIEDTEETDTDERDDTFPDTDTSPDTDTFTGPVNTDFPEVQDNFEEVYGTAIPADILEMDLGNLTAYAGFFIAMGPIIELQMTIASVGQENLTCPTIEGQFPTEGAPLEDITIIGNGCTTEEGKTYNGSLVYSAQGVHYDSYTVTTPSENENCPESFTTTITDGGTRINTETSNLPFLIKLQNEELSEDCSPEASTIFLNGTVHIDETSTEETLINGELTFLISSANYSMWFQAITEDELLNNTLCESEPISGTNTMTNGEDSMVYTFDRATDCDEEPTQMLSINDGESVEVDGVGCAVQSKSSTMVGMIFAFGVMILRRKEQGTS